MRVLGIIFVLFFSALATHTVVAEEAYAVDPITISSQQGANPLIFNAIGVCSRGRIGFSATNDSDEDIYVGFSFAGSSASPQTAFARFGDLFYEVRINAHAATRVCVLDRFARTDHGERAIGFEANLYTDSTLAEKVGNVTFRVNGRFATPRR